MTASKYLQDQYSRDVPHLRPVKGKQNFACLKLMELKDVGDPREALRTGLTCEKGRCEEKSVRGGREVTEVCSFKPTIKQVEAKSADPGSCHYYMQKYEALTSNHSLWNYSMFFHTMKYNRELFDGQPGRGVAIFDEAHRIEEQITQFVGLEIYGSHVSECGIDVQRYDLGDIDSVLELVGDMARSYSGQIEKTKSSPLFRARPDYEALGRLEERYERASRARTGILADRDGLVIGEPSLEQDGTLRSLSVKPVDVSGHVAPFLNVEHQLFMSATIDKPSFCESLGLDPGGVAMVDAPRSPFPAGNREVRMLNVRSLSYRSSRDDEAAVVAEIDRILSEHASERGLILTSSISRCYGILEGLSEANARRVRICHSTNSRGRTQDDVIAEHAADPAGVLLSSSLWEGVDLKGDLSRFQIIAKVPYPNYTDKRIRAKTERFPLWYNSQTLTKVLQGLGRSVRSQDDWATTYVLDAAARNLFFKTQRMIPRAYHDVLGIDEP